MSFSLFASIQMSVACAPPLVLGTFRLDRNAQEQNVQRLLEWFELGCRDIDTAMTYGSELMVSLAIKEYQAIDPLAKFSITTKIMESFEPDALLSLLQERIALFGSIHCVLLHRPNASFREDYVRMWQVIRTNNLPIRHVGVSNFHVEHLVAIQEECKRHQLPLPYCNQIEINPTLNQDDIIEWCRRNNVQVTAHSPIVKGELWSGRVKRKPELATVANALSTLASRYNCTSAQVLIAYCYALGVIPIVKSMTSEHIRENMSARLSCPLTKEDLAFLHQYRYIRYATHAQYCRGPDGKLPAFKG